MTGEWPQVEIHDELYCYRGVARLEDGRKFSAVALYDEFTGRERPYWMLHSWLKATAHRATNGSQDSRRMA